MIGALVGAFGGFASILLIRFLRYFHHFFIGIKNNWSAPFLPAIGAALAVFFVRNICRDTGSHGVPEVIYSISKRGAFLKLRTGFSRLIGCLLTISSGGSAGPEAPIVASGASIGSNIGRLLKLKKKQRAVIVGCGAAGAIASIFNAPVAGMVFTLEVILGEWSVVNVIPIAIASVTGTIISRSLHGNQIPFKSQIFEISALEIVSVIGLALLTAFISIIFLRLLRSVAAMARKSIKPLWLRAGAGGFFVGIMALFLPVVSGEGYDNIQAVINSQFEASLWFIAALILAKIAATCFTVGTGGIGGIFAPCLVIGCFTGLFYSEVINTIFPTVFNADTSFYVLLGMAGVLSSVLQAPLTGIFLIVEITGTYQLLIAVVLIAVLSATLSRYFEPFSIYLYELVERGEFLRPRTDAGVLGELTVNELLEKDCLVISPQMRIKELVCLIEKSRRNYFPVQDTDSGNFLGILHFDDIRSYIFDEYLRSSILVEEVMDTDVPVVASGDNMLQIMEIFEDRGSWSLPVVENGKFIGMISRATILDKYRKELLVQEDK